MTDKFYNFYSATINTEIASAEQLLSLIGRSTPNYAPKPKYLILSPYLFYYLKPLWATEHPIKFESQREPLLSNAGILGRIVQPYPLDLIASHALPPQTVFFATYENKKDLNNLLVVDKVFQALLFHMVSHVDAAYSVLAIRKELGNL